MNHSPTSLSSPRPNKTFLLRQSLAQKHQIGPRWILRKPSSAFSSTTQRFSPSAKDMDRDVPTTYSSCGSTSSPSTSTSMMVDTSFASSRPSSANGSNRRLMAAFGSTAPRWDAPSKVPDIMLGHGELVSPSLNKSMSTFPRESRFEKPEHKSAAPGPGAYTPDTWFASKHV